MELSPLNKVIPSWGAPTLEGFDLNSVQDGQRLKGSARQFVRFYNKKYLQVYTVEAKINPQTGSSQPLKLASREVEREMVEIVTPGDKNTVDDFAEDFHKREHWKHYKAFRDGNSAPIGTPIDECSFISPHIATELKYLGCHTLEQFADSSDVLVGRIGNGWELREFARAMVKAEQDNKNLGQVTALKTELTKAKEVAERQAAEISALREEMKTFMLLNAKGEPVASGEVEDVNAPKRGRPRKIIEA